MDALVFPGQGTFDQCMAALESKRALHPAIKEWVSTGKAIPWCLLGTAGALFEKSEEGRVARVRLSSLDMCKSSPLDRKLKIPHMGWNSVEWGDLSKAAIHSNWTRGW